MYTFLISKALIEHLVKVHSSSVSMADPYVITTYPAVVRYAKVAVRMMEQAYINMPRNRQIQSKSVATYKLFV